MIELSFTVDDYKKAVTGQDRTAVAEFLMRRFAERYIDPISGKSVHGFTKMAVACLLVESVESFRQGWENSDRRSEAAFCYFFDEQPAFAAFRGYYAQFYRNVRCGILHQAETTGSWKITRKAMARCLTQHPSRLMLMCSWRNFGCRRGILSGFEDSRVEFEGVVSGS